MSQNQVIIDEYSSVANSLATQRNFIKLVGAAGQTPQVWVGDVVALNMTRTAAGELAPPISGGQAPVQLNALVSEVSNALPVDGTVVIFAVDGYSNGALGLFPGDSLSLDLTRIAAGPGAPPV